ncbi:hypothetical protein HRF19_05465 [Enterococcus faecalis]|nr:hypothetical protein [Enterococcus faecalis]
MAKKWTEDDDIYLEYFVFEGDTLVEEAADFLGRSFGAVCTRLTELRKKDPEVRYLKRRWSKKEDDFLRRNYRSISTNDSSLALNRTTESVKSRRAFLGLTLIRPITPRKDEVRELIKNGYYSPHVAKTLNIDDISLSKFLKINNIYCPAVPYEKRTKEAKKYIYKQYR